MQHLSIPKSPARLAFVYFLRTGWHVSEDVFVTASEPLETKFNPNHDPTNGQFTFGPGGGAGRAKPTATDTATPSLAEGDAFVPGNLLDGVYRPADGAPSLMLIGAGSEPPRGIGGNYGAFFDPMTLDQAFPGLTSLPGGSILSVSANILDLTGPANEMTAGLYNDQFKALYADIKQIDPGYHLDMLSEPEGFQATAVDIDGLRWDRANALDRLQGNSEPMQIETLRYLQQRANAAYDEALQLAKEGRLPPAPTERMAIGNFVDSSVKTDLRQELFNHEISTGRGQTVMINSREYDSSGTDLTYTVPDARVDDVAFDVTLWRKTPGVRQISGFFRSDFKPRAVIIVRPQQLGPNSTYIISRPGK